MRQTPTIYAFPQRRKGMQTPAKRIQMVRGMVWYYLAVVARPDGSFMGQLPDFDKVAWFNQKTFYDVILQGELCLSTNLESLVKRGFKVPKPTAYEALQERYDPKATRFVLIPFHSSKYPIQTDGSGGK